MQRGDAATQLNDTIVLCESAFIFNGSPKMSIIFVVGEDDLDPHAADGGVVVAFSYSNDFVREYATNPRTTANAAISAIRLTFPTPSVNAICLNKVVIFRPMASAPTHRAKSKRTTKKALAP